MALLPPSSTPPADVRDPPPRTSRNACWPCEQIERLRELWNENRLSASQMAKRLGISRGAVLGKAHRLKLQTHVKVRRAPARKEIPPPRRFMPPPPVIPAPPEPAPPEPDFLGLSLLELRASSCRYPHGNGAPFLFCGQPKQDGSPYCPHHHAISYARPAARPFTEYRPRGIA